MTNPVDLVEIESRFAAGTPRGPLGHAAQDVLEVLEDRYGVSATIVTPASSSPRSGTSSSATPPSPMPCATGDREHGDVAGAHGFTSEGSV
jgi:hypothetical protein